MTVILASQSPRRQELLHWLMADFTVQPDDIDEEVKDQYAPKKLDIPTAVVSVDTVARLSDAIQCHVHVDFTYLRESKHAAVNDFLC